MEWWGKAGDLALLRPAFSEALAHFETALRLADGFGDGGDEQRLRLRLKTRYGDALKIARGIGVPETQAAYAAACEIAATVPEVSERFPAYYGLWNVSLVRADPIPIHEMATTLLHDLENEPPSPEGVAAQRIRGVSHWYEGNFIKARIHLEQALAMNEVVHHREEVSRFPVDGTSLAMVHLPLSLWPLGILERAEAFIESAVARAVRIKHVATEVLFMTTLFTSR